MSKGGMEIWHSTVQDVSPPSERHVILYYAILRCGEASLGQRSFGSTKRSFVINGAFVISGLVDNIQDVVNVTWRLTRYLEHARQRVTGGTVQFGTRTFPESALC